ncbi:DUF4382 domain-containing protein [Chryseotalea sanaruensis]|nr:DUF4382 domain-containing protein [Chryseotalea sanaruensis]
MKKIIRLTTLFFALLAVSLMSCTEESAKGKVQLYITDAPVDDANVDAVFLSIIGVELKNNDGWQTIAAYDEPVTVNILDYQEGNALFLTEEEISAGTYTEARLILDAPAENVPAANNPGCYLRYKDGSTQALFIPSGAQSGYKVKGSFTLAAGGTVAVTLDFDVRKSIVVAGASERFVLKPVVRLVANQDAALIEGDYLDFTEGTRVVVYAYEAGGFTTGESEADADGIRFPNAITSTQLNAEGEFTLAFMNAGDYELVFVTVDGEGELVDLIGTIDATLTAGVRLDLDIDLAALALL